MEQRLSLTWRVCGALLTVLLIFPTALSRTGPSGDDMNPREMHRIEASAKAQGLHRERVLGAAGAVAALDQTRFDVIYYRLNLGVDEVNQRIYGQVTMRAKAQTDGFQSPILNFTDSLTVDSVRSFGRSVVWSRAGGLLNVTLDSIYNIGDEFEVTVHYSGHPPAAILGHGFSFGTHSGVPVISTLSEPYMAQYWWPCKDTPSDKADSVDMIIRVNSSLYAVSNGVLRDSIGNGDGTTTYIWHEQYPIAAYLVSLAISNYARFDRWYHYGTGATDSMPMHFYSYPENLSAAQSQWPMAIDQMGYFAALFGEYPFVMEKYGMVDYSQGSAMEHQTVTSIYGTSSYSKYTICHELAHQWWGDYITCRTWNHIWLNEGFASYCEALWLEHTGGTSLYHTYMNGITYLDGGSIYVSDTSYEPNIFDQRVYDKGAWVLHMLRGVIGDSAFFGTLRAYYNDPRYAWKDAVTEDFRDVAESVSGVNLHDFFNDWIYGEYFPMYTCSFRTEPNDSGGFTVYVHLRQYQTTNPRVFHMPVDLRINGSGGVSVTQRAWSTQREQDFAFPSPFAATSITIDPDHWILRDTNATEDPQLYFGLKNDSLLSGTQYAPYRDSLIAEGGVKPYHFLVADGILPTGLSLNSWTGLLSGTPIVAGTRQLLIRVYGSAYLEYREKSMTLTVAPLPFVVGDENGDGVVDVIDVVRLIGFVFTNGTSPDPTNLADVNRDCVANVLDVIYLIDYTFSSGPAPSFGCMP